MIRSMAGFLSRSRCLQLEPTSLLTKMLLTLVRPYTHMPIQIHWLSLTRLDYRINVKMLSAGLIGDNRVDTTAHAQSSLGDQPLRPIRTSQLSHIGRRRLRRNPPHNAPQEDLLEALRSGDRMDRTPIPTR